MITTSYYLSSLPEATGYLVRPEGRLHSTTAGAASELPRRIISCAHPTVALEGFIVGIRAEDAVAVPGEVGVLKATCGWVTSCRPLSDVLGSRGLARLGELLSIRWRRRGPQGKGEWLRYLAGGWRIPAAEVRAAWQRHVDALTFALDGDTLLGDGAHVRVEPYVKAVELAIARMGSVLDQGDREVFEVLFDAACALLGRRYAALSHRYHETQGLITILAVATAVAASGVDSPIALSFAPLFEMLRAGGVAAVYQGLGGGADKLTAMPIGRTLVERIRVPAYYADRVRQ